MTTIALTLAVLGTLMLGIVTWAWLVGVAMLAVAALITVLRLRAVRTGNTIGSLLFAAAWPIGIAVAVLLDTMKIGPVDSYGEPYLGQLIGFATGSLVFAAGLYLSGRWLRSEDAIDRSDSMATA